MLYFVAKHWPWLLLWGVCWQSEKLLYHIVLKLRSGFFYYIEFGMIWLRFWNFECVYLLLGMNLQKLDGFSLWTGGFVVPGWYPPLYQKSKREVLILLCWWQLPILLGPNAEWLQWILCLTCSLPMTPQMRRTMDLLPQKNNKHSWVRCRLGINTLRVRSLTALV